MKNKRKTGRIMSFVTALAMSLSMLGGVATSSLQVKAAATVSNPRIADDGTVTWDKITFGSYPQDTEEIIASPIKWRILDIDDSGNAFLLADEVLACMYNSIERKVKVSSGTYESCTVQDWLNGTDLYNEPAFIKAAFTDEERNAIIETTVVNANNSSNSAEGDSNTKDKIYLLSIEEASNTSYGFDATFEKESKTRQAKVTDYVRINNSQYSNSGYALNCAWYLDSPSPDYVASVECDGSGYDHGDDLNNEYGLGVRPALHVNLSSLCVKDAGKVTSDGEVTQGTNGTKSSSEYSKPSISDGVTTWDCVYFGNYKQKATFEKKSIEWRVLSVNGNDAFVVADKALDCKPYNEQGIEETNSDGEKYTDYSCTWETCTLRDWLNGTDAYTNDKTAFIKAAFTDEERNAIIETTLINENNPFHGTEGGNNTKDKIYLLSIGEASNISYGFDGIIDWTTDWKYSSKYNSNNSWWAEPTDYANIKGAYVGNSSEDPNYNRQSCNWWLRSPGKDANHASYLSCFGRQGDPNGYCVYYDDIAVRPALHVDLSSSYVKAAGTVSTESKLTDENIGSQNEADKVIALISAIGTVKKDSKTAIDSARNAYNALPEAAKDNVTNYSVLQEAETKYAKLIKDDAGNTTGGSTETTSGTTDTGGAGSSVEAGTAVSPASPGITESVTGSAGSGSTEGSGSATGKAGNGSTTESGAIESPAATSDVSNEGQAAVSSKLESTITSKSFKKTFGCKAFSVAAKTNSDGILEYASDNNKVATISKDGKIKIKGCGKANITITSPETSNYTSSSKTVTVTVLPGKPKLKKISSPKKSQIYFSWSKMQGATEYQYNISETKSFKKARVYSGKENYVKKAAKEASRKTYYVRVRAVTRIDGKKYYGKWSTVKSVEIK